MNMPATQAAQTPDPQLYADLLGCGFYDIIAMAKAAKGGTLGFDPNRAFAEGGAYFTLPGNGPKERLCHYVAVTFDGPALRTAIPEMKARQAARLADPTRPKRNPAQRAPRANPAPVPAINPAPVAAPAINPPPSVAAQEPAPLPLPQVNPDATNAAQDLAAILARIMAQQTAQVNPEQVRAIAQAEVSAALAQREAQRPVIAVHVAGREPVRVEEHTHPLFPKVLALVGAGLNVMMKGPAGCGKTHMAGQVFKALGLEYAAISGSAGASEAQLTGRLLPTGDGGRFEYHPSSFVRMYENGGGFLFDELDAFDPNMLIVCNSATANGRFTIDARTNNPEAIRHDRTALLAATNTFGTGPDAMYVGRFQLDESTLDRWYIVEMDYDRAYESQLAPPEVCQWVWQVRERAQAGKVRRAVSTRMIQKAGAALAAGLPLHEVKADLLRGWSRDERAKVGA